MKGKLLSLMIVAIIVPVAAYLLLGQSGPTASVSRLYNLKLQTGDTINVNITVSDAPDITSFRVNLAWDPQVLKVTTGDPAGWTDELTGVPYGIYEGDFLERFSNSTIFIVNEVNNIAGNITAIYEAVTSVNVTASGSGVVAIVNFTCVSPGTTAIRIVGPRSGHSSMQSSSGDQALHQDVDGLVTPDGPPGIWTEPWFQITAVIVIIEIIIVATGILLIIRWWRSRIGEEKEEEAALGDLVR